MRCVSTVVNGIKTPIIKENDDLASVTSHFISEYYQEFTKN